MTSEHAVVCLVSDRDPNANAIGYYESRGFESWLKKERLRLFFPVCILQLLLLNYFFA